MWAVLHPDLAEVVTSAMLEGCFHRMLAYDAELLWFYKTLGVVELRSFSELFCDFILPSEGLVSLPRDEQRAHAWRIYELDLLSHKERGPWLKEQLALSPFLEDTAGVARRPDEFVDRNDAAIATIYADGDPPRAEGEGDGDEEGEEEAEEGGTPTGSTRKSKRKVKGGDDEDVTAKKVPGVQDDAKQQYYLLPPDVEKDARKVAFLRELGLRTSETLEDFPFFYDCCRRLTDVAQDRKKYGQQVGTRSRVVAAGLVLVKALGHFQYHIMLRSRVGPLAFVPYDNRAHGYRTPNPLVRFQDLCDPDEAAFMWCVRPCFHRDVPVRDLARVLERLAPPSAKANKGLRNRPDARVGVAVEQMQALVTIQSDKVSKERCGADGDGGRTGGDENEDADAVKVEEAEEGEGKDGSRGSANSSGSGGAVQGGDGRQSPTPTATPTPISALASAYIDMEPWFHDAVAAVLGFLETKVSPAGAEVPGRPGGEEGDGDGGDADTAGSGGSSGGARRGSTNGGGHGAATRMFHEDQVRQGLLAFNSILATDGTGETNVEFVHPSAVFTDVTHMVPGIMHRPAKAMTKYPEVLRVVGIQARPVADQYVGMFRKLRIESEVCRTDGEVKEVFFRCTALLRELVFRDASYLDRPELMKHVLVPVDDTTGGVTGGGGGAGGGGGGSRGVLLRPIYHVVRNDAPWLLRRIQGRMRIAKRRSSIGGGGEIQPFPSSSSIIGVPQLPQLQQLCLLSATMQGEVDLCDRLRIRGLYRDAIKERVSASFQSIHNTAEGGALGGGVSSGKGGDETVRSGGSNAISESKVSFAATAGGARGGKGVSSASLTAAEQLNSAWREIPLSWRVAWVLERQMASEQTASGPAGQGTLLRSASNGVGNGVGGDGVTVNPVSSDAGASAFPGSAATTDIRSTASYGSLGLRGLRPDVRLERVLDHLPHSVVPVPRLDAVLEYFPVNHKDPIMIIVDDASLTSISGAGGTGETGSAAVASKGSGTALPGEEGGAGGAVGAGGKNSEEDGDNAEGGDGHSNWCWRVASQGIRIPATASADGSIATISQCLPSDDGGTLYVTSRVCSNPTLMMTEIAKSVNRMMHGVLSPDSLLLLSNILFANSLDAFREALHLMHCDWASTRGWEHGPREIVQRVQPIVWTPRTAGGGAGGAAAVRQDEEDSNDDSDDEEGDGAEDGAEGGGAMRRLGMIVSRQRHRDMSRCTWRYDESWQAVDAGTIAPAAGIDGDDGDDGDGKDAGEGIMDNGGIYGHGDDGDDHEDDDDGVARGVPHWNIVCPVQPNSWVGVTWRDGQEGGAASIRTGSSSASNAAKDGDRPEAVVYGVVCRVFPLLRVAIVADVPVATGEDADEEGSGDDACETGGETVVAEVLAMEMGSENESTAALATVVTCVRSFDELWLPWDVRQVVPGSEGTAGDEGGGESESGEGKLTNGADGDEGSGSSDALVGADGADGGSASLDDVVVVDVDGDGEEVARPRNHDSSSDEEDDGEDEKEGREEKEGKEGKTEAPFEEGDDGAGNGNAGGSKGSGGGDLDGDGGRKVRFVYSALSDNALSSPN